MFPTNGTADSIGRVILNQMRYASSTIMKSVIGGLRLAYVDRPGSPFDGVMVGFCVTDGLFRNAENRSALLRIES